MGTEWWLLLIIGNVVTLVASTLAPNQWGAGQVLYGFAAAIYALCAVWLVVS